MRQHKTIYNIMKVRRTRHFGKLLNKSIRQEQHNISKIARQLNISRPTLYTRIEDNGFTPHQLKTLHDKHYIVLTIKELEDLGFEEQGL